MIVAVRGSHGAGKSHAVRAVMDRYPRRLAIYDESELSLNALTRDPECFSLIAFSRDRPLGYVCQQARGTPLFIPGHYETECGGCDTIDRVQRAYDLIRRGDDLGWHVVYEGILVQHSGPQLRALKAEGRSVVALVIDVDLEVAHASVIDRRRRRGEHREYNPKSTASEHSGSKSTLKTLREAGFDVRSVTRETVVDECLRVIGYVATPS